ncbi:MAG TPA: hypothetical protein DEQ51_02255 [Alphaproteobacteria bacterium]|nr:hypothetical protein [Alphaproteobacteria bacterium]
MKGKGRAPLQHMFKMLANLFSNKIGNDFQSGGHLASAQQLVMLNKAECQRLINTVQGCDQRAVIADDAGCPHFEIHPACRRLTSAHPCCHQGGCQTACNLILRQITCIWCGTDKLSDAILSKRINQLCCQHAALGNPLASQFVTVGQNQAFTCLYIKRPEPHQTP